MVDMNYIHDEPVGAQARLADPRQVGGCNTCTHPSDQVWVICGFNRQLEFRMCPSCMNQVQQAVHGPKGQRAR